MIQVSLGLSGLDYLTVLQQNAYRVAGLGLSSGVTLPLRSVSARNESYADIEIGFDCEATFAHCACSHRFYYHGRERWFHWSWDGDDLLIAADTGEHAIITSKHIACDLRAPLSDELMLGPALLVAGAFHGRFALHASCLTGAQGAVVVCGVSGAGKSTLAHSGMMQRSWRRVSDDITVLYRGAGSFFAAADYPQLKLSPRQPYDGFGMEAVDVRMVCVLGTEPVTDVVCEPLPPLLALGRLIESGVCGRLFNPALLASQLAFFADLVASVPVMRLNYPRRMERLPDVLRYIDEVAWQG